LHAILFVQVEAVVAISVVLSKNSFNLSIGIATPANIIITECIYSVVIMPEIICVSYFVNLQVIQKLRTEKSGDKQLYYIWLILIDL